MTESEKHGRYKVYGPKQGAECECGTLFYPTSQARVDIIAEWRFHVWQATGAWPESKSEDD